VREPRKRIDVVKLSGLMIRFASHYGNWCSYCHVELNYDFKKSRTKATTDHIICHAEGGTNDLSNLTLCCSLCNSRKSNKPLAAWREKMGLPDYQVWTFADMPDGYGPYIE